MTANPVRSRAFGTHAKAVHYLERVGFIFTGAPDRWNRLRDERTVSARIVAVNGVFYIRFAPSKTAA